MINTFGSGWWTYWYSATGQFGLRFWVGFVAATLVSAAAFELFKMGARLAWASWR